MEHFREKHRDLLSVCHTTAAVQSVGLRISIYLLQQTERHIQRDIQYWIGWSDHDINKHTHTYVGKRQRIAHYTLTTER